MNCGLNKASPNDTAFILCRKNGVGQNPQFRPFHRSQSMRKVEPISISHPARWDSACTLYLQEDENMLCWPSPKRAEYFQRPIFLGGELPKIAGSGDSTESKSKETIHPNVQRQFTPTSFMVSSIPEIMRVIENEHNQKELLFDFNFLNQILLQLESPLKQPSFIFGTLRALVF